MQDPIFDYRITEYDRRLVPSLFVAAMDEGVRSPAEWIPRTGRSLGHPGWGFVYHISLCVLRKEEFNLVIETGTNLGSTAIVLAQALKDSNRPGKVITIELDPEIASEARRRVALAGAADRVDIVVGDSADVLPDVLESGERVRIAVLDGDHFHDHVVAEFEQVETHLGDDSLVVFDNTKLISEGTEDPRVNGALRTIRDRFGGNLINFPVCSWYTPGIAIWQRKPFTTMEPPAEGSFESGT